MTKKTLVEGKFIRFIQHNEWEYVERSNCTGIVIIVAMTDDEKVIFVEQYRPPVDKKVIEFPAGLVNDLESCQNETLLSAAKRELLEEAGYEAKRLSILTQGPVSSGLTSDLVTMIRATGLKKVSQGGGEPSEMISGIHAVPLKSVETWLKNKEKKGYLIEPKIYAGLYFLKKSKSK